MDIEALVTTWGLAKLPLSQVAIFSPIVLDSHAQRTYNPATSNSQNHGVASWGVRRAVPAQRESSVSQQKSEHFAKYLDSRACATDSQVRGAGKLWINPDST